MRGLPEYDRQNAEKSVIHSRQKVLIMSDTTAAAVETVQVEQSSFSCDGGGGALGHPRVQLTLDKSGQVDCGYCGLHFELKPQGSTGATADTGH
jgi:uncharacterized Zn-finger protein